MAKDDAKKVGKKKKVQKREREPEEEEEEEQEAAAAEPEEEEEVDEVPFALPLNSRSQRRGSRGGAQWQDLRSWTRLPAKCVAEKYSGVGGVPR